MIIRSLELKNYRNYGTLKAELSPGINLLYGDNAQGKTNFLEAVYLCASAKSHRGSKDRELIRFGEEEAHIKLLLEKKEVPCRIDIHFKKDRAKGIAVNGMPIRKASELFGTLNTVLFSPEDLNLIKNGPADRRRFMDLELCQLDRLYVHALVNYNRVLVQRNKLLKEIEFDGSLYDTLQVWDEQLVSYGTEIIRFREEFIRELDPVIRGIHSVLSGGAEELFITYEKNTDPVDFPEHVKRNRKVDMKLRQTTVGPHRDDIGFYVVMPDREIPEGGTKPGMDLRRFGSQGQQRTGALSLKLAEIEIMKRIIKDDPVLLLDDVLSELDTGRQKQLLKAIRGVQTVMTCTGMDEAVRGELKIDRRFEVRDGGLNEFGI